MNYTKYKLTLMATAVCLILAIVSFGQTPWQTPSRADKLAQANALYDEAYGLFNQHTAESYNAALAKLQEASRLYQEIDDKSEKAGISLLVSGFISDRLGEKAAALKFYEKALLFFRAGENKNGEAATLNNIGKVYSELGENQKAIEFYKLALPLRKAIGDKRGEATTLSNIGTVYSALGEKQKALEYYNLALPLGRQVGDKHGEATTLSNIGTVYSALGENQKAIEFYNLALHLQKALGDKSGEAATLNNIGTVYSALGEKQKALEFYNLALPLSKAIGDKHGEATTLSNIGKVYSALDEKLKALEFYKLALPLQRAVGNKSGEATTLNYIGMDYSSLDLNQQALEFYNLALPLSKAIGDKHGEAVTLNNIMYVWESLKNGRLAIFYGKQSVNLYQELRQNITTLDKEIQQTYLKTVEHTYRKVAGILIVNNRLAETQQVLNSFKDQQFFDFNQTEIKQTVSLVLTPRETDFFTRYEKTSSEVGSIGSRLEELKRKIVNRQPTADETAQLQKLENDLKTASDAFLAVLKQAEIEFSKPQDEKDKVGEIPDLRDMQTALRELSANTKQKTAAVYQLVGVENFHLLVITADEIKSVSTPVKNSVVNEKALDFWALLQSPVYDPNLVGKELYDVIFKPLESVLPKDTKTILWSLDGNLRYVPMAALFDGKQYLAERFNHVNFTRADKERVTRNVKPVWTATGLGTSAAKTVELLGSQISFEALPGVGEELKMLFKQKDGNGIFSGETFLDAGFTKQKMLDALRAKRPLVHIASHFSFRAGDEARSFLLLGDGTAFTLADMKRENNLFEGVELLTLSACNTAAQQTGANGREVDGFAELAQRLGTNSVMATLWSVADCTTPWLMREFYDSKLNKNKNKAESLREAQRGLISGKAEIKSCPTRTDLSPIKIVVVENETERKKQPTRSGVYYLDKKNAPLWDKDKHPPFAHPFYWSPFILFGNWK